MARFWLALGVLVIVSGCGQPAGMKTIEESNQLFSTPSERDKEKMKWIGFQADQQAQPA